jgi:hypothetical protein
MCQWHACADAVASAAHEANVDICLACQWQILCAAAKNAKYNAACASVQCLADNNQHADEMQHHQKH